MKILARLISVFFLFTLLISPVTVLAQSNNQESMEEGDSSEMMEMSETGEEVMIEEVNSFELFWPMVAGRTRGDSLYAVKRIKEKVRGWLIFGQAEKADYAVFLGTKRVLEVEKLLGEGKNDLANKTMEDAKEQFAKSGRILEQGVELGDLVHTMNGRIDNLLLLSKKLNLDDLTGELESLSSKL